MLMVSKKIVYEETRRKINILIHKSYIGIEIVFYFLFPKEKIDFSNRTIPIRIVVKKESQ